MLPDSGAASLGRSASADCKKPPPETLSWCSTPEDDRSDLMESGLPDLPTHTGFCDEGRTLWTRPRMT